MEEDRESGEAVLSLSGDRHGECWGKWPTKATFSARGSFPIKSKTLSPSLVMGIEGDQMENLDKQGG